MMLFFLKTVALCDDFVSLRFWVRYFECEYDKIYILLFLTAATLHGMQAAASSAKHRSLS